jgi:hypothetical protein
MCALGLGLGLPLTGAVMGQAPVSAAQWIASATKDHDLIWDNTEKWNSASDGFTSGFSSGYRYNLY